tara:strand:+ start:593 stop:775 length:183 start_codon:yes stop_codon:yes gene_type:complete
MKDTYRRTLVAMHKIIEDELFRVESGGEQGDPAKEILDIELAHAVDWAYAIGVSVGRKEV